MRSCSPRQPIPDKVAAESLPFPIQGGSVYRSIGAVLALLEEELEGREVHVHFGLADVPSWLDRLAMGVFVANLMRLRAVPKLNFSIDHARGGARRPPRSPERAAGSVSRGPMDHRSPRRAQPRPAGDLAVIVRRPGSSASRGRKWYLT